MSWPEYIKQYFKLAVCAYLHNSRLGPLIMEKLDTNKQIISPNPCLLDF